MPVAVTVLRGCETVDMRRAAATVIVGFLAVVVTSCTTTPRTATNFCRLLERHRDTLTQLPTTGDKVAEFAERYAELLEVAPLAVERDWAALTRLMREAADVDPNDAEAVEALVERSYLTEASAMAAAKWVLENCGVDIATWG